MSQGTEPLAERPTIPSRPPVVPPSEDGGEGDGLRERIGLWLGPLAFAAIFFLPAPDGMPAAAWRTTAVAALMGIWWVTEPIPIPATALLPLVLFPALGILPMAEAAGPYSNLSIFLYMGGFVLALAMERSNLHRRIALTVVRAVGVRPDRLVLGVMIATAFLSMWVSNTATAMMMLPIALSVAQLSRGAGAAEGARVDEHFALNLMLGVAYAASIGGLATLIGTPTNAVLSGFMRETYALEVGFAQWMMIGVPLVAVVLPLSWLVLTRAVYPIRIRELPGGRETIDAEYARLGPVSSAERRVAVVFVLTACFWIFRPLLGRYIPGLDDAGIAIGAALVLFLVPSGRGGTGRLMDWKTAERLPWGVLLLFGGGLSLAGAVTESGLADWIGGAVGGLGWAILPMMLTVTLVVIFFTELASNTATAAAFLPLVASIAVGLGENPLLLAAPAALAASCGFMMPAGTPPNAIAYGSGYVTVPQMARAGFLINVLCAGMVVLVMYTVGMWALDIEPGVLPAWAR